MVIFTLLKYQGFSCWLVCLFVCFALFCFVFTSRQPEDSVVAFVCSSILYLIQANHNYSFLKQEQILPMDLGKAWNEGSVISAKIYCHININTPSYIWKNLMEYYNFK